jgi:hypothetical protein
VSGLHDLMYTRYPSVTHAMIIAVCERWHLETSNFYQPVGEMTITLDHVANLLHILIEGKMLCYDRKVTQDRGVELMVR